MLTLSSSFPSVVFNTVFVFLALLVGWYPSHAVVQQSGIADQLIELPIDSSTCTIQTLPFPWGTHYSCAEHMFQVSTNRTVIPILSIHWYYRSTVVVSNGTGCTMVQVQCTSLCGSSSTYRTYADGEYLLPSCACVNSIPYTENITVRVLSPFTNTSGNALPYPPDCGSLPTGTSKIIYTVTDPVNSNTNNNNGNNDVSNPSSSSSSKKKDAENVYGAPLEVVIIVCVLSTLCVFAVIRAIIRYQNDSEETENSSKKDIEPLPEIVVTDDHVDEVLGAPPLRKVNHDSSADQGINESKYDDPHHSASGTGMTMIDSLSPSSALPSTAPFIRRLPPITPLPERSLSDASSSSLPSTTSGHSSNKPSPNHNGNKDNNNSSYPFHPLSRQHLIASLSAAKRTPPTGTKSMSSSVHKNIKPPHIPDRDDDTNSGSSPLDSRASSSDSSIPSVPKI